LREHRRDDVLLTLRELRLRRLPQALPQLLHEVGPVREVAVYGAGRHAGALSQGLVREVLERLVLEHLEGRAEDQLPRFGLAPLCERDLGRFHVRTMTSCQATVNSASRARLSA